MEKKVYTAPAMTATCCSVSQLLGNSDPTAHEEEGNKNQLSRRRSGRRQDWDFEDEEDEEYGCQY